MTIENQIRDVVKEIVREELQNALRESVTALVRPRAGTTDFLTIAEAAQLVGVHEATVRTWIRRGELRGHRAGRHYRVRRSELDAFNHRPLQLAAVVAEVPGDGKAPHPAGSASGPWYSAWYSGV